MKWLFACAYEVQLQIPFHSRSQQKILIYAYYYHSLTNGAIHIDALRRRRTSRPSSSNGMWLVKRQAVTYTNND